jgi:hypothetical protein
VSDPFLIINNREGAKVWADKENNSSFHYLLTIISNENKWIVPVYYFKEDGWVREKRGELWIIKVLKKLTSGLMKSKVTFKP